MAKKKRKDQWNVTFRKKGGKWSKPMVYSIFKNAERRMRFDDRGWDVSGEYQVEIRRGTTRSGKLIRQHIPRKNRK